MTYAETVRRFGFPYTSVRSIAQTFEEEGRMEQKERGGNHHSTLQDKHIAWLKGRLDENPDPTVISLQVPSMRLFASIRLCP
ncbi:hypothetical protein BCR41DRAFT_349317 [Lobosporangium transversale]|uniref:Uncharacterized protein n=1 Tax=Lobosporangium transversale TaxID=64571 RepID=A0A1Y2GUE0_9FUNG|nr:hypothetical protein BCR41DRAFT_349317 [Lobosporangium transversale]ORZ23859.1 hypothetical protein BCR41DRAFT_349317 [Lobosporangium transversale]|eukprot:XP_021883673.1 hypothetical protein BCR41DRAFT_349317 [Lobosporangium transversale]